MDLFITAALLLAAIGWSAYTRLYLGGIKEEIQQLRKELHEAKQARMKTVVSSRQTPQIDSRGRTSHRDTKDLPRTGRMTNTTNRKKDAGLDSDG